MIAAGAPVAPWSCYGEAQPGVGPISLIDPQPVRQWRHSLGVMQRNRTPQAATAPKMGGTQTT